MSELTLVPVSADEYLHILAESGARMSVEQHPVWDRYDAANGGRDLYGGTRWAALRANKAVALLTLKYYTIKHICFLWARSGPTWLNGVPTRQEEIELLECLRTHIKSSDSNVVALRLHTHRAQSLTVPCCQRIAYDKTVVIDVNKTPEEAFKGLRSSGRRFVNKARRECPAVVVDDTAIDFEDFKEYATVMAQTGERDKFATHGAHHLFNLLSALREVGAVRLYGARVKDEDNRLLAWVMVTMAAGRATYYYAASTDEGRTLRAPDLIMGQLIDDMAGKSDIVDIDMMGVGSDIAPDLNSLNQFKGKFADIVDYPWPVELLIKPGHYRAMLALAKGTRTVRVLPRIIRHHRKH